MPDASGWEMMLTCFPNANKWKDSEMNEKIKPDYSNKNNQIIIN